MTPNPPGRRLRILALFALGMSPQFCNGWYLPWMSHHLAIFWIVDLATMAALPAAFPPTENR